MNIFKFEYIYILYVHIETPQFIMMKKFHPQSYIRRPLNYPKYTELGINPQNIESYTLMVESRVNLSMINSFLTFMSDRDDFCTQFIMQEKHERDIVICHFLKIHKIDDDAIFCFIYLIKAVFLESEALGIEYVRGGLWSLIASQLIKIITDYQVDINTSYISNCWENFVKEFIIVHYEDVEKIQSKISEFLDRLFALRIQYIFWRDQIYPKRYKQYKFLIALQDYSEDNSKEPNTRIVRRQEAAAYCSYIDAAIKCGKVSRSSTFRLAMVARGIILKRVFFSYFYYNIIQDRKYRKLEQLLIS